LDVDLTDNDVLWSDDYDMDGAIDGKDGSEDDDGEEAGDGSGTIGSSEDSD